METWISGLAMAPEPGAHLRVKGAIYMALDRAVTSASVPCQALPDCATVETGEGDYEPDALMNCGEPMADDAIAAPNPVMMVEVLSPGTTSTETGGKVADYFREPSVAHYLIAHPTRRTVTHRRRTGDAIDTRIIVNGPITMAPPGSVIAVEEIYGAVLHVRPMSLVRQSIWWTDGQSPSMDGSVAVHAVRSEPVSDSLLFREISGISNALRSQRLLGPRKLVGISMAWHEIPFPTEQGIFCAEEGS
jgi:Uma2 family endonuclease